MNQTGNLAPPKRLFTWVDIDEHLALLATARGWPTWLKSADCWWDGLELVVESATDPEMVSSWLDETFGTGSTSRQDGTLCLRLDDPRSRDFTGLPVTMLPDDNYVEPRRVPALRERHITTATGSPFERPEADNLPGDTHTVAFHSFKGGVGRTLHAVALADAIARQGRHVLLVDADLEAPGITWMYRSQSGPEDFCYEDLIALLHAADDGVWHGAVEIGAAYLPNQQVGRYAANGRVTVLPATRRALLGPPRIEPTDLLVPERSPYFLTEAIAGLADKIGAEVAVVDLRAGGSELSAPVLLDPRVQRVFVTSLSHQSLSGTKTLIQQLISRAPTIQGTDPASAVVITQYRPEAHNAQLRAECSELSDVLSASLRPPRNSEAGEVAESVDRQVLSEPVLSPFHERLLALPPSWDAVTAVLDACNVAEALAPLMPRPAPFAAEHAISECPEAATPAQWRHQLHDTARSLIYAEGAAMSSASGFLVTDALSKLLGDHRTEPPVALVVGAKGSGKTFMFAKACVAGTWEQFATGSGISDVRLRAPIIPVLESPNLEPGMTTPQDLRGSFAARWGETAPGTAQGIKDALRHGLSTLGTDEVGWRTLWLRCLALAAGVDRPDSSPDAVLTALAKKTSAVFVIDGLEDLLQSMNSEASQTALRVLLIDVLNWLRALRGQPLGLVVFVRQDLVGRAVRQNSGQLLARYESYALRWDREEALRLALWVTVQADALPDDRVPADLTNLSYDDLVSALIPVWGWKMGTEKSREARSHLWVPAALGDFNNQVQARDVVVFLAEAAKQSVSYDGWDDRLLVPSAMRKALLECSTSKIEAIREENLEVGGLLRKLEEHAGITVPFDRDTVGLSLEQANFLVESGVFAKDPDGQYWVAEIYRHGLGFGSGRRARVLWG
ncbi:AAA family ATPase [Nocardia rhamnosiphila]|uniref:KGGVGR-motif variant AAA ATPase n=1 Tax=Nocardia rhamnosiphila TaxID=426716 RepID=UPI003408B7DB